jgi:hypothetical protein
MSAGYSSQLRDANNCAIAPENEFPLIVDVVFIIDHVVAGF